MSDERTMEDRLDDLLTRIEDIAGDPTISAGLAAIKIIRIVDRFPDHVRKAARSSLSETTETREVVLARIAIPLIQRGGRPGLWHELNPKGTYSRQYEYAVGAVRPASKAEAWGRVRTHTETEDDE